MATMEKPALVNARKNFAGEAAADGVRLDDGERAFELDRANDSPGIVFLGALDRSVTWRDSSLRSE